MADYKDMLHPNWVELREQWVAYVSGGLERPAVSVEQLLSLAGVTFAHRVEVGAVAGVREKTFTDIIFLREKALYCYETSRNLDQQGFATWAGICMYDACFFATKALVYLLGFRDAGRSAKSYFHLFYEEHRKGLLSFDGHYGIVLKERMTHESLWTIFTRMISTARGKSEAVSTLKSLRGNDYNSFTKERNALTYGTDFWSKLPNLDQSDLWARASYAENLEFFNSGGGNAAAFVDKYYRTALTTLVLLDWFLADIGTLAPSLTSYLTDRPGHSIAPSTRFD